MKKNYQIVLRVLTVALLFGLVSTTIAQNANRPEGSKKLTYQWYLNGHFGITQAFADIQAGDFGFDALNGQNMNVAGGLRLGKHISPVFGIFLNGDFGKLQGYSGVDTKGKIFETDYMEGFLGATLSFSNLFGGYKPRLVNIYALAGIGMINFKPAVWNQDPNDPQNKVGDQLDIPNKAEKAWGEGGGTSEAVVPVGLGIDFRLSDRWDINVEANYRIVDGDKMDGYVSGENTDAYTYYSVGAGYSFGQGKSSKINIETEPTTLSIVGDSVPVVVKGNFPDGFDSKSVVAFAPVLKYGDQTKQLETMYFQGTDVTEENQKPGAVVVPEEGGSFTYSTTVAYEPGMDICEVYVDPMVSYKGKEATSMGDRKVADGLIMTNKRFHNSEHLLLAPHGFKRDIVKSQSGTIYFVVNKSNLNFNFKLNKTDEAKQGLADLKAFIENGWEIKNVEINAWASPEGEESFNQGLSQRRAESAKKYAENEYNKYIKAKAKELGVKVDEIKQDIQWDLRANGEDWDGFMKAVQASNIKDKNIIANVVNSQPDLNKREQEIRNMTVIYKEIEEEILPPLRRAVITVNSYEPSYTDEEIAQYATSDPDKLNVNALLYAATLTTDANAQLNIYKTIISKHPKCWRAFNNAGYAAAELGDFNAANNYFAKARQLAGDEGIVLNNEGAMAAKKKNWPEAKQDYLAAQKQGIDVSYNMGIIKLAEGNYSSAVNSFSGEKCDYNLALAHVLAQNYNAAKATLNCSEKTADNYYLMAIIGARTSDDNMVFENLKNAIAKDPKYKEVAASDREFLKYYANPNFQNAIK